MSGTDQRKILFSCLSESDPEWLSSVQGLVLSLRRFGGACRTARFVVNYVDRVPAEAASVLSELGAETRSVAPLGDRGPQNKLRMLDLHESFDFDVLVALDCDTVVVGDPSPHIPGSAIGAKPVDYDPLSQGDWRRLCRALDNTASESTSGAVTPTSPEVPPCFNSGVLTVPRSLCGQFQQEWLSSHSQVVEALGADSRLIPRHLHFFADQFSLAFCLARTNLSSVPLPVSMNFPTHVPVDCAELPEDSPPLILHYHDATDQSGFLYRPRSALGAAQVEAFNLARAASTGVAYPGLRGKPLSSRIGRSLARRFWSILAVRQRMRSWLGGAFRHARTTSFGH